MPRTLLCALLALGVAVCSGSTLEPLPLDVSIQASRATAAPGDTIAFVVDAQGGQLLGVELSYGDDSTDQFGTGGARTARVTFKHAYLLRGTYLVRAVVTDALAGQKEATAEVRVN
jgi:hypothetical protein